MSTWTTVFLDYCPLDKLSLGLPPLGQMFQHLNFGQPQKLKGYWLPQNFEVTSIDFDDTSKDFETTSIDWRLG